MNHANSISIWMGQFFPAKGPTPKQKTHWSNIWWRVLVSMVAPRDEFFDARRDVGAMRIEPVLQKGALYLTERRFHLGYFFPERWLTVDEEEEFVNNLVTHPEVAEADLVVIDLITKSQSIVKNFLPDDVRFLQLIGGKPISLSVQEWKYELARNV